MYSLSEKGSPDQRGRHRQTGFLASIRDAKTQAICEQE
jgi:hypothetical protein